MGRDRLVKPRCSALALPYCSKGNADIALDQGPGQRHALARIFLKGTTKCAHRLLQARCPGFALPQSPKRVAEIVLGRSPVERHALARVQLDKPPASLDCQTQSCIVAVFAPLPVQSACLSSEIVYSLVFVSALRGKHCSRIGKMVGRFCIAQSGERDFTAPG